MRTGRRYAEIRIAVLLGLVVLESWSQAAVVTRRLSTPLAGAGTTDGLPQAWVAPVEEAPTIDGRLDEKAWTAARPIVLGMLRTRGTAAPKSELRLMRKDGVLYVGCRLDEPNVAGMKRGVTAADGSVYQDDSVEMFLSPSPADGYCQIIVGAGGADHDRHGHGDPAHFDAKAKAAVAIGKKGWSLEVAVPMARLGAGEKPPLRWRANFYRNRYAGARSENQAWSPTFRGDYDVPERFGYLLLTPECPWAQREATARRQQGITIEDAGEGTAVVRFDLASVPKKARIYRARLVCARREPDAGDAAPPGEIQIYPLAAPYKKGAAPQIDARPLPLVAPWYRSFDVTGLVAAWVGGGRPNYGLYVKRFDGWRKEKTFLDLAYEGQPGDVPPQVTGLRAFHRAGQTFLTWKEIEDPVGRDRIAWGEMKGILDGLDRVRRTRYCVYRHARPITAANLHEAELIAAVRPLSCWNLHGRGIARPIDELIATADVLHWHQWNPFRDATVDGDYGRDCPIDRLVITEGQPPLARGTGLYVHTATRSVSKSGPAYYAVLTRVDGVENTIAIGPANSLAPPVRESVAEPEPVLQGELPKMPFFNYRQRRLHYVRWVASPYSNRPYDYYNWSVGVPDGLAGGSTRVPLELNLHRDGYGYWRTHYRIEPGSIVLCPHDFPLKTWWYGYHEARGNLRSWTRGAVHDYTEKRLLWFVDWAARKWPVDRNRILVTGCNGGASGSGALHLGLRHPEVFNLVIAGHGEPDYRVVAEQVAGIWGPVGWAMKTAGGRNLWEELDLVRHVRALRPDAPLPFVSMTYDNRQQKAAELAEALMAARQPVLTHTAWGGQRMVPVSATATNWCVPLDIRKDRSMLAVAALGKTGDAVRNGSLLWQTDDLVDGPDRYAVTIRQTGGPFSGTITLRRLQRFGVQAGRAYAWKLEPVEANQRGGDRARQPRQGTVTVGKSGLLTIRADAIPPGTYRLTVLPP